MSEDYAPTEAGTLAGDAAPRRPAVAGERYVVLERIGEGGMGVVDRVHDRHLERDVARKTLHWRLLDDPGVAARFEVEATITAGLQHPGVVPIYDRGATPDGRAWYTMRLVAGQTLAQRLAAGWPMRRGVDALLRVAEALAYSHTRGVLHRDVKPANIMVGDHGEILLLDWGIARRMATAATLGRGTVGTPRYMAPEQWNASHAIDPAADVFAWGACLYHVLMGAPPWSGSAGAVLAARAQVPRPRADQGPQALCDLAYAAMHPDPATRPGAAEIARSVRAWLDGDLARAQALALLDRADAARARAAVARREAAQAERAAARLLEGIAPTAPVEEKLSGWRLEDAARAHAVTIRQAEAEYGALLASARQLAPDLPAVRAALDALWRDRLLAADAGGDAPRIAEYTTLLTELDAPGTVEWLRGDGRVTLVVDAPAAQVEVLRYTLIDRRLVALPTGRRWAAPIIEAALPMGSYLFRISARGRHTVDYPVHIERLGVWDGVRPGSDAPHPIHLPPRGSLRPSERYVPAGWCRVGGDPDAADALPGRRIWVDGFVIARDPVTQGAFLDWLHALRADGRVAEAEAHAPRDEDPGADGTRLFYARTADGGFALRRAYNMEWTARSPVVRVSWRTAMAFAAWRSRSTGRPWRLPHSWEWEKAARGVDGRALPWGSHLDPTWAGMAMSFDGPPRVDAVDARALDISPFGVRGMAGNVRDLCLDLYRKEGPRAVDARCVPTIPEPGEGDFVIIRGGSYSSQVRYCRPAGRFGLPPEQGLLGVGFRLAAAADPHVIGA